MAEHHTLYGGKLHVYKRPNSRFWQCSAYLKGKNRRVSSKEESLQLAKEFAEDWYLDLRGRARDGNLKNEKTFKQAAEQFRREFEVITEGQRSPRYVEGIMKKLDNYLIPFFGDKGLSEITPGLVQEYRIHRQSYAVPRKNYAAPEGHKPNPNTIHQEMVALRQTLKTAVRHGWLDRLPDLSTPYRANSKITRRAWFSPEEYRQLYEATRRRAKAATRANHRIWAEQLHDYVLLMANTGLRPDEVKRLQYRDVEIVEDEATDEVILLISVRGKRGVGYCKSMPGAVRPFERMVERNHPEPSDLLFPIDHAKALDRVLREEDLKFDREGQRRTAYSLRHTYICMRLTEGADIYQVAKNCRTSVEMIQKYYAAHIADSIDAAAVNVRKPRKKPQNQ
ncbi:tyrosine-type recombinase/integrase [Hyphobacterium sp.]|uniref:tyrosine-type recombinase/integrase n=1 Tax=Hyphobacterium sp. TaxID=2004662 RepID=UPI003BA8EC1F